MNKFLRGWVLGCAVATVAVAGGDTAKDAKMAGCPPPQVKVVKEKCAPAAQVVCPTCERCEGCPVCPPPVVVPSKVIQSIEYKDVIVHEGVEGWVAAGSLGYVSAPLVAAGGGYRWANGVTLLGQVAWLKGHDGTDDATVDVSGHDASPRHVFVPGYAGKSSTGVIATVVIPLGRR